MVANSSLKLLTYALSVLLDPCLMMARRLKGVSYFLAPWNWRMNNLRSCVQEATISGSIFLKHFLAVAINVTAKHRHRAAMRLGVGPFDR